MVIWPNTVCTHCLLYIHSGQALRIQLLMLACEKVTIDFVCWNFFSRQTTLDFHNQVLLWPKNDDNHYFNVKLCMGRTYGDIILVCAVKKAWLYSGNL